jgi:hypothetical protein
MAVKKKAERRKTKTELLAEKYAPGKALKSHSAAVVRATMSQFREHGGLAMTAGEAGQSVVGIPCPSFAFEYLVQNTAMPLDRFYQIVGQPATYKSALGFEFARWFRKMNGAAVLLEHESKYSPDWSLSFMGWDDPDALGYVPCGSINDWQRCLQDAFALAKTIMVGTKKEPGPGRTWPYLAIIDSIMGKSTEETQKKIEEKGFAGRAFSDEARMITAFLRGKGTEIMRGWPFVTVAINHLKLPRDERTGLTNRSKVGGKHIDFQETWELETSWQGDKKIRKKGYDGTRLFIACKKNSLGITDQKIPVDVLWHEEMVYDGSIGEEAWRQVSKWDWFSSSIQLLLKLPILNEAKAVDAKKICNVQTSKGLIFCRELGISKKSPLSTEEAGMVLQETPAVLNELRRLFGIKVRRIFDCTMDYRKQLVIEKRNIKKKIRAHERQQEVQSDDYEEPELET